MSVFVPSSAVIVGNGRGLFGPGGASFNPNCSADFTQLTALTIPSWATVTVSGVRTQFDSSGKLTTSPNQLITNASDFTNMANWDRVALSSAVAGVTAPDGSSNGATLTEGLGTAEHGIYNVTPVTTISGNNYIGSVALKAGTRRYVQVSFGPNANAVSVVVDTSTTPMSIVGTGANGSSTYRGSGVKALANGFYRVWIAGTLASTQGYIGVNGSASTSPSWPNTTSTGSQTIILWGARLSQVTYEIAARDVDDIETAASAWHGPRLDYVYNGTSWVCGGLRAEGSRTNYAYYSNNLAGASLINAACAVTGGATDLSGGTAGVTVTASIGLASHIAYKQGGSLAGGTTYTATFWVRQGTAPYTVFGETGGPNYILGAIKWSDLSVSVNGIDSSTVATPVNVGNGIYRVSITFVRAGTAASQLVFGPYNASVASLGNNPPQYSAVGTETTGCVAWQVEGGAYTTTLIPTTNSTSTRATEVVSLGGIALTTLQGASGAVIIQTTALPVNIGSSAYLLGNMSSNGPLYYTASGAARTWNGTNFITAGNTVTMSSPARAGVTWSPAGRAIVSNGGAVVSDANTFASSFSQAVLGANDVTPTLFSDGLFASVALYNQRIPDALFQAKTIVGASFNG